MDSDYKIAKKRYDKSLSKACGRRWTGNDEEMSPKEKVEKCKRLLSWLGENKKQWVKHNVKSKKQIDEQIASVRGDPRWQHDVKISAKEIEKIEQIHAKLDRYMAMHLARMEHYYLEKMQEVCEPGYKIPKMYLLGDTAKGAWPNLKDAKSYPKVSSSFTSSNPKTITTQVVLKRVTQKSSPQPNQPRSTSKKSLSSAKPIATSRPSETIVPNKPCHSHYIPHHRNLQLYPWATDSEIHSAYQELITNLNPRSLNYPSSQYANATAARALVENAYSYLYLSHKNRGPGYLYKYSWTSDPSISSSELARREAELRSPTGTAQLPWFQPYHTPAECLAMNSTLCQEFFVNLSHKVLDTILPFSVSDYIWAKAQERRSWRYPSMGSSDMTFYGVCDEAYSVLQPVPQALPGRWSYYRDSQLANTPLLKEGYSNQMISLLPWVVYVSVFAASVNVVTRALDRMVPMLRIGEAMQNIVKLVVLFCVSFGVGCFLSL